jgi:predicted transposase YbfD/YdcC
MDQQQFTSLFDFLKALPDYRQRRGRRYLWVCLLTILCAAVLSGQATGSAIAQWALLHQTAILTSLAPCLRRIPSGSTLRRTLRHMGVKELERLVAEFIGRLDAEDNTTGRVITADGQVLRAQALDGKDLRGASVHGEKTFLVSLVRHESAATLAQQALETGGSEIEVGRQLLAGRDLAGTVTTMDALHTSQPTAQQILNQHGHYLMMVKENQPTLYADIVTFFAEASAWSRDLDTHETQGKAHGRRETRTLTCSSELTGYLEFPGAQQVVMRRCQRLEVKTGKTSDEIRYAVTSLSREQAGAEQLELLWRGHWTIENREHYVRDETWREDRCQLHKGNAAQALAAIRNLLMAVLRYQGCTNVAETIRSFAASAQETLAFLSAPVL